MDMEEEEPVGMKEDWGIPLYSCFDGGFSLCCWGFLCCCCQTSQIVARNDVLYARMQGRKVRLGRGRKKPEQLNCLTKEPIGLEPWTCACSILCWTIFLSTFLCPCIALYFIKKARADAREQFMFGNPTSCPYCCQHCGQGDTPEEKDDCWVSLYCCCCSNIQITRLLDSVDQDITEDEMKKVQIKPAR